MRACSVLNIFQYSISW